MDTQAIIFAIVSIGGLGIIFGAILGFASKIFAVDEDPRVGTVSYTHLDVYKRQSLTSAATSFIPLTSTAFASMLSAAPPAIFALSDSSSFASCFCSAITASTLLTMFSGLLLTALQTALDVYKRQRLKRIRL